MQLSDSIQHSTQTKSQKERNIMKAKKEIKYYEIIKKKKNREIKHVSHLTFTCKTGKLYYIRNQKI